jgi:prolyl-tRNA editing enzyme YbaK/EbsC (Cys-tRNA(Pro) deacylase)
MPVRHHAGQVAAQLALDLVDAAVMERPEIVLGGGGRDGKLRLAPRGLARLPGLQVVPGLARRR